MDYNHPDYIFKILILGDSGVGKSSMIKMYTEETFDLLYNSTIGIDFKVINTFINDKSIKLQVWDTAGQERFRAIISNYYRGVHGVIIMFDLTNLNSFNNIDIWFRDKNNYCSNSVTTLFVGTKSDLKKDIIVTPEMIDAKCIKYKCNYIETSTKNNYNIKEIFDKISNSLMENTSNKSIIPNKTDIDNKPTNSNFHNDIVKLNNNSIDINKYKCCIIS